MTKKQFKSLDDENIQNRVDAAQQLKPLAETGLPTGSPKKPSARANFLDKGVGKRSAKEPAKKVRRKELAKTKAYTLFDQDLAVISTALNTLVTSGECEAINLPSASDVVRAALQSFGTMTAAQQSKIILSNRAQRGRPVEI